MQHYYSNGERSTQLSELAQSLDEVISALDRNELFPEERAQYDVARQTARRLLSEGFSQSDLIVLHGQIPSLFWPHKEWTPPLGYDAGTGKYQTPDCFETIEPLERRVVAARDMLRQIGYY